MHTLQSPAISTATRGVRGLPLPALAQAVAVTLSGLSAGFFFTYQISVTRGLAIVDDVSYVQSFQAINETIRNAPFGIVFFGTVPAIAFAAFLLRRAAPSVRVLMAAGFVLSLAVVVITFTGSVPLNNELATAGTSPIAAADAREGFENMWNQLNLARTVASIGAAAALALASVAHRNVTAER